jgi:hypothetical protein
MNVQRSRLSSYAPSVTATPTRPRLLPDVYRVPVADNGDDPISYDYREETLVVDVRAGLRPAQCVEEKLLGMLKTMPVSQVRSSTPTCSREHC